MKLPWLASLAATAALLVPPLFWAAQARERAPEIQQIVLSGGQGSLLLSASVRDAFPPALLKTLAEGGELTFTFHVELIHKNTGLFRDKSDRITLRHHLRHDRPAGLYVFTAQDGPARKTASLREARQWMSGFSGLPLAKLSSLKPDAPYAVEIQAVLAPGALPAGLGRFAPGGRIGGIRTDRRTIEFRY